MKKTITEKKEHLELLLSTSAFRRGSSAFRHGLVLAGYSDHLPIDVLFHQEQYRAISWNMLADEHLWNNFRNISGIDLVEQLLVNDFKADNPYLGGNIYHLYVELAKYLYDVCALQHSHVDAPSSIVITPALLDGFIDYNNSRLSRSRNKERAALKSTQILSARAFLIQHFKHALFSDETPRLKQDIQVSIQHALELIYHIQHEDGALQWKNRLSLLQNNKPLCRRMAASDFLCLQECTSPTDIMSLLAGQAKPRHKMISYKLREGSGNDHCALFFDADKFSVVAHECGALNKRKPYLMARFEDNTTGEQFIVSSIHHPGGNHYLLPQLMKAQSELDPVGDCPYYMMGDFNNTADFYRVANKENQQHGHQIHFPQTGGTLAGSDFGNLNQAIDAVMTNDSKDRISIDVVPLGRFSPPAPTPIDCRFASARFFQPVVERVTLAEAKCLDTLEMKTSDNKRAEPVDLALLLNNK